MYNWLVVSTHLKILVNWDDYSQHVEKTNVPNHQPVKFMSSSEKKTLVNCRVLSEWQITANYHYLTICDGRFSKGVTSAQISTQSVHTSGASNPGKYLSVGIIPCAEKLQSYYERTMADLRVACSKAE